VGDLRPPFGAAYARPKVETPSTQSSTPSFRLRTFSKVLRNLASTEGSEDSWGDVGLWWGDTRLLHALTQPKLCFS
jgi:hypothetical protein